MRFELTTTSFADLPPSRSGSAPYVYRVKELNLPKTSCKGAVPADEPTRYKVDGSDRNRTCGLFRGDCFQDSVERQPHSLPNVRCYEGVEPSSVNPQSTVLPLNE